MIAILGADENICIFVACESVRRCAKWVIREIAISATDPNQRSPLLRQNYKPKAMPRLFYSRSSSSSSSSIGEEKSRLSWPFGRRDENDEDVVHIIVPKDTEVTMLTDNSPKEPRRQRRNVQQQQQQQQRYRQW